MIQQIIDPGAVLGGDREKRLDSQAVKRPHTLEMAWGIHLVHDQRKRLAGAAQKRGQLLIARHQVLATVHHQQKPRRFLHRHLGVTKDFRGNQLLVARHHTAGIDHLEIFPVPFGLTVQTVAGHARLAAHQGAALAA